MDTKRKMLLSVELARALKVRAAQDGVTLQVALDRAVAAYLDDTSR